VPQVIALAEYRAQLYDYLKNRMTAISPNLTTLVGELVGARLIAHAGSLVNLAKQPASTLQVHPPPSLRFLQDETGKSS
jgi:nucleolar protein 58